MRSWDVLAANEFLGPAGKGVVTRPLLGSLDQLGRVRCDTFPCGAADKGCSRA